MKKAIKSLIVIIVFLSIPLFSMAQTPPHPNGGGEPGSGNIPVGGGAPIGGGLLIMMALGMGYASKKTIKFLK